MVLCLKVKHAQAGLCGLGDKHVVMTSFVFSGDSNQFLMRLYAVLICFLAVSSARTFLPKIFFRNINFFNFFFKKHFIVV